MISNSDLEAQLEASDWRRYEQPNYIGLPDTGEYCHSYQKRVRDEEGNTKYFITLHKLDSPEVERYIGSKSWFTSPETQFNKGGVTFNVEMLATGHDLDEIEAFFESVWRDMEADYYEAFGGGRMSQQEVKARHTRPAVDAPRPTVEEREDSEGGEHK